MQTCTFFLGKWQCQKSLSLSLPEINLRDWNAESTEAAGEICERKVVGRKRKASS